jgi:integrase/recombinase XerD
MHPNFTSENEKFLTLFETYLLTEKRVSKNTFCAYQKDIGQLFDFFKKNKIGIRDCEKTQLKKYLKILKDQGVTARTLSRKISSIKALFRYLSERFNLENKGDYLTFPKLEQTLPLYLTQEEVEKLLETANKDVTDKGMRNKVMLYLVYASGMRVSELVNLTIDQIQFDTGFISLMGKGNKERMVPLPKNVMELLKFYLDNVYPKLLPKQNDAVQEVKQKNYLFFAFYKNKIKPISRQSFWLILKEILSRAQIVKKVSPHSLRHSLATHLLKSGADIRSLQLLLGHEHLSTVQIYTHLEKSQLRKVYDKKHPRA